MRITSSACFAIIWNQETLPFFSPSRGIRQGDPLSPYLFVLCLEKLSHLIQNEVSKKKWKPLQMSRKGPELTHVCFADDLILFGEASKQQIDVMMGTLNQFCTASGERVNFQKSRILVSSNVHNHKAKRLSRQSGIPLTNDFGKYLGAPMIHGRVTKQTYKDILSNAQARLQAWENKVLSLAGRVTLIKSVLNSLPSYLMQTTYLPEYVISEMNKMTRAFLWGDTPTAKKLHLLNWEKLCLPTGQGGLNLRDLRAVNLAYMAKLCWKILQGEDRLWIEVMSKKYLKKNNLLSTAMKSYNSYTWKSILRGREILLKGIGMKVNNGRSTKFWIDEWLPCGELILFATKEISEEEGDRHVADYCTIGGGWEMHSLKECLPSNLVDLISSILVNKESDIEDSTSWKYSSDGNFELNSAYQCQLEVEQPHLEFWTKVWEIKCPAKLKYLLWKALLEILPTSIFLNQRKLGVNRTCFRCSVAEETILHALRDCELSKTLWLNLNCHSMLTSFFNLSCHDWILCNLTLNKQHMNIPWSVIFCVASWLIWFWRNSILHTPDFVWPSNTVESVYRYAKCIYDTLGTFSNRLKYTATIQWHPPVPSVMKINVDASIRHNSEVSIAGGVVRDCNGKWQTGFIYRVGISDVLTAELWAIFQGLCVTWDRGYRNVILESDSALAVNKILNKVNNHEKNSQLLIKINELLRRGWDCSIKFVHREANCAPDWLVRNQDPPATGLQLLEDPPNGILHLLQADSIGVQRLRFM